MKYALVTFLATGLGINDFYYLWNVLSKINIYNKFGYVLQNFDWNDISRSRTVRKEIQCIKTT